MTGDYVTNVYVLKKTHEEQVAVLCIFVTDVYY